MTTRTRKQAPAKKTTAKAPAKKTTSPARKPPAKKALPKATPVNTVVDLRRPLPVRRRVFVGPMGVTEQAAIRAALASAKAGLPVPVRAWNGPIARLKDGTVLTHTPAHATTNQRPTFHAAIRCPHEAVHAYTIHTAQDLHRARQITALCDQRTRQPKPPAVHPLPEGIRRATASAPDTQPLSGNDITAGIAARAADAETPKEHPEP